MKRLASLAAVLMLSAAPAYATDCYIGGKLGASASGLEVEADGFKIADLSADGFSGGVVGGCDVKLPDTPLVVGLWGDYVWHGGEFDFAGVDLLDLKNQWAIGGRAGLEVVPGALVYGLLGYTELELDGSAEIDIDPDFGGWVMGGGVEFGGSDGFVFGAEYRYSRFKSEVEDFVDLEPSIHSIMLVGKYKFKFAAPAAK